MKASTAARLRLFTKILGIALIAAFGAGLWFYFTVRASLPRLDGNAPVAGLNAPVTVERDALGVPTIRGANRPDVARALGFVHAQDRFFQMDLARRHAAGEMAELLGKKLVAHDRGVRIHGFRTLARAVLTRLPAEERALLKAYTAGVNAGLAQLGKKPFEYGLLRSTPQPWKPEDSVLMHYAMTLDLQDQDGNYEQSLAAVRDRLGTAVLSYFAPLVSPDDASLDGSAAPLAPMPSERAIDLRKRIYVEEKKSASATPPRTEWPDVLPGSNALALAGAHTASGAGLLANDMHLSLRVPNIWYRVSLVFPSADGTGETRVTGVTLAGTPVVVAGSNGHVAWGYTNAFADVSDLVLLSGSTAGPDVYSNGLDLLRYEKRRETIQIKGAEPETIEIPWTIWGPVIGKNADNRDYALKWTAHDPDAVNFGLLKLENARTVQDAITIAHAAGIPVQNFVAADASGTIGWTLCGKLPKRAGFDGRLPVMWSFGDRRWDGFVAPEEIPTLIAPADGRLWSGNQRHLGGAALALLGDGGYERPLRATRLRDLLTPLENARPADLLAVQLDVQAPHLARWQKLLAQVLDNDTTKKKARRQLREALDPWEGQASVESVSYRIVAGFRRHVIARVLPTIFEPCYDVYPDFNFRHFRYEDALWDVVEKKPAHLLGQDYPNWGELLLAAADDVIEDIDDEHTSIARASWGRHNAARIRHPLSSVFPGSLGSWLDLPADPLPGDNEMPRVQSPTSGASERFAVSPGREAEGIFHMPGGQSGHPLSPFYRAGHADWAQGRPAPFLPGPAIHTLTLTP